MRQEKKQVFQKKVYRAGIYAFVFFSASAVISAVLGHLIDRHFDIAPVGSLSILAIFFVLNWIVVLWFARFYINRFK